MAPHDLQARSETVRQPRPTRRGRRAVASLALAAAGALAGCAIPPTMQGEVQLFHRWEAAQPFSYAFRPTESQIGSLEHRSYEQLVRERLGTLGFTEAPAGAARYQVVMQYQATPEQRRVTEWYTPGVGPGFSTWGPGPWAGPRPFAPYWRYDPWVFQPMPISRDLTQFRHELRLDLYDVCVEPAPGRKVFESRAVSVASSDSMPRLMPGLVAAVLDGFPGESGSTRRVEVPLPEAPRR